jgi:indole-3-glycerol phosphate synthase
MDKLNEIMAWKEQEIKNRIRPIKDIELSRLSSMTRGFDSFSQALSSNEELSIIAEIKRKSPSAGAIASKIDAKEQARNYVNANADAISVLTDEKFFDGKIQDLWDVTEFLTIHNRTTPCIRKDFMIHPIQVIEAAEAGAEAILIIVRALTDEKIKLLYDASQLAGLDSLFEIHSEAELDRALAAGAKIIGVNNRDLKHFFTDLSLSETLLPQIPDDILAISESGIHTTEDAERVRKAGADAILVGEALMKHENPEEWIQEIKELG